MRVGLDDRPTSHSAFAHGRGGPGPSDAYRAGAGEVPRSLSFATRGTAASRSARTLQKSCFFGLR